MEIIVLMSRKMAGLGKGVAKSCPISDAVSEENRPVGRYVTHISKNYGYFKESILFSLQYL